MELFEIIKSSISIFSATAFVFMSFSYTIFKIRERSRVKPYSTMALADLQKGIINDDKNFEPIGNTENKPIQVSQPNGIIEIKLPIQNRFRIINRDMNERKLFKPEHIKENIKYGSKPNIEEKNIFNFYGTKEETMHKMKLATR